MADKVLLFLSKHSGNGEILDYTTPENDHITGIYSNDAPVKYLLGKYPRICEIVCVTTPEARADALDDFKALVQFLNPTVKITPVDYLSSNEDFSKTVLPNVLRRFTANDIVYLDTTGGKRNVVMDLLLAVRAMDYSGVSMKQAVYAEKDGSSNYLRDVTHLYQTTNLISGMEELARFGSVAGLRKYYEGRDPGSAVTDLLDAMESFNDDLALCRTAEIVTKAKTLEQALKSIDSKEEVLLSTLKPFLQERFGGDFDLPGVVRWCINTGKLQQALTFYNENTAKWLVEKNILNIDCVNGTMYKVLPHQNKETIYFMSGIVNALEQGGKRSVRFDVALRSEFETWILENNAAIREQKRVSAPEEIASGVDALYKIIQVAYPYGHYCSDWRTKLSQEDRYLGGINGNPSMSRDLGKFLNQVGKLPQKQLDVLFNGNDAAVLIQDGGPKQLKDVLQDGSFRISCPENDFTAIIHDYAYIRRLRNCVNHCADEIKGVDEEDLEKFKSYGFNPSLTTVSAAEVKRVLQDALEHLKNAERQRKKS